MDAAPRYLLVTDRPRVVRTQHRRAVQRVADATQVRWAHTPSTVAYLTGRAVRGRGKQEHQAERDRRDRAPTDVQSCRDLTVRNSSSPNLPTSRPRPAG